VEQRDLLKRYLDAGMAFTAMTRTRAEAIVKELTRAGEVQREQVQAQVDDLVQRSRHNTEQLRTLVRKEIGSQFTGLGLATKRDLGALERRLTERFGGGAGSATPKKAPAKKAKGKKAVAKKTPAKKTPAKKAAAKRAAPGIGAPAAGNPRGHEMGVLQAPVSEAPLSEAPVSEAPVSEVQPPRVSDS
jgi:polyhydroxyalkanoate synthesis regulator phasin